MDHNEGNDQNEATRSEHRILQSRYVVVKNQISSNSLSISYDLVVLSTTSLLFYRTFCDLRQFRGFIIASFLLPIIAIR